MKARRRIYENSCSIRGHIGFLFIFLFYLIGFVQARHRKIDSLIDVAWNISYVDYQQSLRLCDSLIQIAEQQRMDSALIKLYNCKATIYADMGWYDRASQLYSDALRIVKRIKWKRYEVAIRSNQSILFSLQQQYSRAVEELKYAIMLVDSVYKNPNKAKTTIATLYVNIFLNYDNMKQVDSGEYYIRRYIEKYGLDNRMSPDSRVKIYLILSRIALYHHDYITALQYLRQTEPLYDSLTDYIRSDVFKAYAMFYEMQKKIPQAIQYYEKAISISHNLPLENVASFHQKISELYAQTGNLSKSHEYLLRYVTYRDSLMKIEKERQAKVFDERMKLVEAEYALQQVREENILKEMLLQQEKRQKRIITIALVSSLLLLLLMGYLYIVIRGKNRVIDKQNKILHQQHKDITDSIRYAGRIQQTILPSEEKRKKILKDSMLFYLPRDIVAGDFYWIEETEKYIYVAVADCTGHGVPGAMVSMVCSLALNKTLLEEKIYDTNKILDRAREIVMQHLAKENENVKDGMDVSICRIDKNKNELQWSGANALVWIVPADTKVPVQEVRGDKQPVGYVEHSIPFTAHTIQFNSGDVVYLFTDGYADQFGGERNKKMKKSFLRLLIAGMREQSLQEQRRNLEETFFQWKGNNHQTDDVCVLAFRV